MEEINFGEIKKEFTKCKNDPVYFISTYTKVVHPKRGLVPFKLYPFQEEIVRAFQKNRFNILKKFRQAGCTTICSAFSLWYCMFNSHKTVAIISKGDAESTEVIERIKLMHFELPDWLRPKIVEDNAHKFRLENRSVIIAKASSKDAGRSIPGSLLILDEIAFNDNADSIWTAAYPILSLGGGCIALSTCNGVGNWFHRMWSSAVKKENQFNTIQINFKQHPEYVRHPGYEKMYEEMMSYEPPLNIDEWEKTTRANLTYKEFSQEYLAEFLGTGETYLPGDILIQLYENTNKNFYIKYNNRMRVWQDPQNKREYGIGVDVGLGRERDYSAFHIIDLYNGEQVAEFYSNRTPINEFAEIVVKEARLYNTAYVLPERNMIGENLIYFLRETYEYENLVMDEQREIGIQISQKNRENLLADMEHHIRSNRVKINSERLVDELLTFIIDPDTGKIKADNHCHDDLIMSFAVTIFLFNDLRQNSYIEKSSVIDNSHILPNTVFTTKYKMTTATGGVSEEDLKWLMS